MIEELPAIIQHAVIGGKIGGPLVEVVRLEAHQRIVAARESKLAAVQAGADRLAEALQRVKHSLADGRGYADPDDDNVTGWLPDSFEAIGQAEQALAAYQAGIGEGDAKEEL